MKKLVTYRRAANKLRTKNRDLSRSKETMDRRFGNNGSVSSLGVRYRDSDGDGYKDKITKTRRPSSLVRDASYGGSQPMAGAYSRAVANSASPNTTQEFENAVAGREYTAKQLEDHSNLVDQGFAYGNYVDSYHTVPTEGSRITHLSTGADVTLLPTTLVNTTTVIFRLKIHADIAGDVSVWYGTADAAISGTSIPGEFGNDGGTSTNRWPGVHLFFAWQSNITVTTDPSAGTVITRTAASLAPGQLYYFRWNLDDTGPYATIPTGYYEAGLSRRSSAVLTPPQKFTMPSA